MHLHWCGVEGVLERPGRLRWRDGSGRWQVAREEAGAGQVFTVHAPVRRRADGLVLERPGAWESVEDPMVENYRWVSMLDPVELASGVEVEQVVEVEVAGRPAWRARCRPTVDYDPRCACCPLLWSRVSDVHEYGREHPWPAEGYPQFHDVTLDRGAGIVLALVAGPGTSRTDLSFRTRLLAAEPWPGAPGRPG